MESNCNPHGDSRNEGSPNCCRGDAMGTRHRRQVGTCRSPAGRSSQVLPDAAQQRPGHLSAGAVPNPATDHPAQFPGHDELSTAYLNASTGAYSGTFMADDFSDFNPSPIVHVMWWGSYMNNYYGNGVNNFLIAFETNKVVDGVSYPDQVISSEIVTRGQLFPQSSTFTETPVPLGQGPIANPDGNLPVQRRVEPSDPGCRLSDRGVDQDCGSDQRSQSAMGLARSRLRSVQSLGRSGRRSRQSDHAGLPLHGRRGPKGPSILASRAPKVPPIGPIPPGWVVQLRQRDAAEHIPAYDGISSSDLAFALYTVPEPGTVTLLGLGGMALLLTARRRRPAG